MQRGDAGVEPAQARQVGVGVARELPPVRGVGGGEPALDLRAPRPRRCAGRATSAGRTWRPRRRWSRPAGARARRRRGRRPRRRCRCRRRSGSIQLSRLSPLAKTSFAPAAASTSLGRGSYSCGSVLGWRTWSTETASPPTSRTQSPIWVVVATTSSWPSLPEPEPPQPAAEQRQRERGGGDGAAAPRGAGPAPAPSATRAKTAPATQAIVAPGGASVLTESQSPTRPLDGDQGDAGQLPAQHPAGEEAGGRRRDDEQRRDQQRADHRERRGRRQRDQTQQGARRAAALPAPRRGGAGVEARGRASAGRPARWPAASPPAATAARAMSPPSTSSRLPNSSVSTLAPEPKTSLARITPAGQAADEDEGDDAVAPALAAAAEGGVAGGEDERGAEGAERRREAEPVGEDQARERPRCRPRGRRRRGRAARSRCRAGRRGPPGSGPRPGRAGRREAGTARARQH